MYESAEFEAEKLVHVIHAALGWPDGNPWLSDAWNENGGIVARLIYDCLYKHERAITQRILDASPDEVQLLKDALEKQRMWDRQQRW